MDQFFAGDEYTGAPFELFGGAHLVALAIVLGINLFLLLLGRRTGARFRTAFRYGGAALLIVNELLWHLWNFTSGKWSLQETLPLHLCSLFVFLSAYMLVTRDYRVYEFAYFLGIGGALQPLLTPDAGMFGFPHFRFFQVMISHGMIVTAAVYMTAVEGYRPTWASLRRVLIGGGIYMAVIFVFNLLTGSNYLFIARKPATASLMDVLPDWPVYILFIVGIALVVFFILYLPFWIKDLRAGKRRD